MDLNFRLSELIRKLLELQRGEVIVAKQNAPMPKTPHILIDMVTYLPTDGKSIQMLPKRNEQGVIIDDIDETITTLYRGVYQIEFNNYDKLSGIQMYQKLSDLFESASGIDLCNLFNIGISDFKQVADLGQMINGRWVSRIITNLTIYTVHTTTNTVREYKIFNAQDQNNNLITVTKD